MQIVRLCRIIHCTLPFQQYRIQSYPDSLFSLPFLKQVMEFSLLLKSMFLIIFAVNLNSQPKYLTDLNSVFVTFF